MRHNFSIKSLVSTIPPLGHIPQKSSYFHAGELASTPRNMPPRSFPPGHISGGHWSVTSENVFTMDTHSCLAAANLAPFPLRYVWGTVKTKISIKKQRFGSLPAPLWVPNLGSHAIRVVCVAI